MVRSTILIGYDGRGNIVDAKLNTLIPAEDIFTKACEEQKLYQLKISEFDIMTSVDACQYSTHAGLNETLTLSTIDGKELSALFYEVVDIEYLASRERMAKRKRLMLTPDFSEWRTTLLIHNVNKDFAGNKPVFQSDKQYNSLGAEKIVEVKTKDGKAVEQE